MIDVILFIPSSSCDSIFEKQIIRKEEHTLRVTAKAKEKLEESLP